MSGPFREAAKPEAEPLHFRWEWLYLPVLVVSLLLMTITCVVFQLLSSPIAGIVVLVDKDCTAIALGRWHLRPFTVWRVLGHVFRGEIL